MVVSLSEYRVKEVGRQSTHAKVQELMAEFNIQCDNLWYLSLRISPANVANSCPRTRSPRSLPSHPQNSYGKHNAPSAAKKWSTAGNILSTSVQKNVTCNAYPPLPSSPIPALTPWKKFDNDKTRLQQLNKKQEADKIHVDRYRHQEHLSSQIDQLKLRIPFARYRGARAIQSEKKEERNAAKASVQTLQQRDAPMVQRVEAYKARKAEYERQKESRGKSFDRVLKAITEQEKEAEKLSDRAIELRNDLTRIRKTRQTRLKDIAEKKKNVDKARHSLAKWEEEVTKLPPNWRDDVNVSVPILRPNLCSILFLFVYSD